MRQAIPRDGGSPGQRMCRAVSRASRLKHQRVRPDEATTGFVKAPGDQCETDFDQSGEHLQAKDGPHEDALISSHWVATEALLAPYRIAVPPATPRTRKISPCALNRSGLCSSTTPERSISIEESANDSRCRPSCRRPSTNCADLELIAKSNPNTWNCRIRTTPGAWHPSGSWH